jgi:hypothetical protein
VCSSSFGQVRKSGSWVTPSSGDFDYRHPSFSPLSLMATNDFENKIAGKSLGLSLVDGLADSVNKITLETEDDTESSEHTIPPASRTPLFRYSRPQILFLYKSPLVQSPEGMPELKDWFG